MEGREKNNGMCVETQNSCEWVFKYINNELPILNLCNEQGFKYYNELCVHVKTHEQCVKIYQELLVKTLGQSV